MMTLRNQIFPSAHFPPFLYPIYASASMRIVGKATMASIYHPIHHISHTSFITLLPNIKIFSLWASKANGAQRFADIRSSALPNFGGVKRSRMSAVIGNRQRTYPISSFIHNFSLFTQSITICL